MTPEEITSTVIGTITLACLLTLLVLAIIFIFVYDNEYNKIRVEYLEKLDDHDKKIINEYKNLYMKVNVFKKKAKKK